MPTGYNPAFLDEQFDLGLPSVDGVAGADPQGYLQYDDAPFELVMSTDPLRCSAICVASNIRGDYDKFKLGSSKSKPWTEDPRVELQLGSVYYKNNPWDKGHLAMRHASSWGDDKEQALASSRATYVYTNAGLQLNTHYNQDEWGVIEKWSLSKAKETGAVTEFNGPVYAPRNESVFIWPDDAPSAVQVPAAFFKIVCWKDETSGELAVRAFLVKQDFEAMAINYQGSLTEAATYFQVTIAEVEERTGIRFDPDMARHNPLGASNRPTPERIPIHQPTDIIDQPAEQRSDVRIESAMPNPKGSDAEQECIVLKNYGSVAQNLEGWILRETRGAGGGKSPSVTFTEEHQLAALGGEFKLEAPFLRSGSIVLNNTGDSFELVNKGGHVVSIASYTKKQVKDGVVIIFQHD